MSTFSDLPAYMITVKAKADSEKNFMLFGSSNYENTVFTEPHTGVKFRYFVHNRDCFGRYTEEYISNGIMSYGCSIQKLGIEYDSFIRNNRINEVKEYLSLNKEDVRMLMAEDIQIAKERNKKAREAEMMQEHERLNRLEREGHDVDFILSKIKKN